MNTRPSAFAAALAVGAAVCASAAHAQVVIPSEFESAGSAYSPLFSYFGGVASFGAEPSATTIHSGRSLRCWANFRHDNIFRIAGFAVGSLGLNRSAGALAFPAAADTFSITIDAPPAPYTAGQLQLIVALREDDDGDGVIDTVGADDQWESDNIHILPGRNIYNIPVSAFTDTDPDAGNNVRNFSTTGRMGLLLTFESATSYPGGIIEAPMSLLIDHAGLYTGPQSLPTPSCPGDFNGVNGRGLEDLFDFLVAWFAAAPAANIDGTPGVGLEDLFAFLVAWFTPCP